MAVAGLILAFTFFSGSLVASTSALENFRSVPAFLWSDHAYLGGVQNTDDVVPTSKQFASGLFQSLLHSNDEKTSSWPFIEGLDRTADGSPDLILAFVSKQAGNIYDIASSSTEDDPLFLFKQQLDSSNTSLSLPRVNIGDEKMGVAMTLVNAFNGAVVSTGEHAKGSVAMAGACGVCDECTEGVQLLVTPSEVEEYLMDRVAARTPGQTDLLVICSDEAAGDLPSQRTLEEEVSAMTAYGELVRKTTAHYMAVYISDPLEVTMLSSQTQRRILMKTYNSTHCDADCQYKASILEGLGVVLVLLITLISGLCCMYGIESPTRFEVPKDN
eukprot:TRINITY_DN20045_c0_g1_i1.p1 TRINITY_DN20045_c0_g1~~TRINITY_DN20045_c0_g1_i1.p1  ORF type:complete len:329 (-),score=48.59 TRINITY_DN20045_c0_g1_i1:693-1679(-)